MVGLVEESDQRPATAHAAAYDAYREGRLRERYDSFVVDDTMLEQGLEAGTLSVDTRLRDVLRTLAVASPRHARSAPALTDRSPLALPTPDLADQLAYAEDISVLVERDSTRTFWKLRGEIESLRRQLKMMERSWSWRSTTPLRASRNLLRRARPR